MHEPKNSRERKIFKESCIASYIQEMQEINEWAPNVEDLYYSDHLGCWIATFKRGGDQEFDTKFEALKWIESEANSEM
jgi:hypothetical protein